MWKDIKDAPKDRSIIVIDMHAEVPVSYIAHRAQYDIWGPDEEWFVGHQADWFENMSQSCDVLGVIDPTHWTELQMPTREMCEQYALMDSAIPNTVH